MKIIKFNKYNDSQNERMNYFSKCAKGRVLDVGGEKYQNSFFNSNPNVDEVHIIDIKQPIEFKNKYKYFKKCDLNREAIPYNDNFFDTVVAGEVIEHLENPYNFLTEINRVLKNDGIFILSTPTSRYFMELLYMALFGKHMEVDEKYGHIMLYSRLNLRFLLKKHGFSVKKIIGHNFWIPVIKIGFVNTNRTLPEIFTWQNIYIAVKTTGVN